jgi:hypothetical protein
VLRIAAVPVILIVIVIYFLTDLKTYDRFDLIDGMMEANGGGVIENGMYTNDVLGLYFETPELEGANWHIIKYTDQFTRPPTLNEAYKAEFAALDTPLENDILLPSFILRAQFMDRPHSRRRKETSEEFGKRMRDDYVRKSVSRLREEYKNTYIISDSEPIVINGNTYYYYTAHNMVEDYYFTSYIIRMYGFGYRFMFYSWDKPLDYYFINEIMYSVQFEEPTVEFTMD